MNEKEPKQTNKCGLYKIFMRVSFVIVDILTS